MKFEEYKLGNCVPDNIQYDQCHHSMYSCIAYYNHFYNQKEYYQVSLFNSDKWINNIYFYISGKTIEVMGALSNYTNNEITDFCNWLFVNYPNFMISWGGFYYEFKHPQYKIHKTAIVSDIILDLPNNEDGYLKKLNQTTRKHVLYYQRRIIRDCPNVKMKVYQNNEINIQLVEKIVYYNHLRMNSKNISSDLDQDFIKSIYQMCLKHGIIHTIELDNRLIAATINIQIEKHAHLAVISHDPEYNKYNPGQVALYNTIIDCINQNCERFHFLWDMSDYKKRFGGRLVELYYYHIFEKGSFRSLIDYIRCKINCKLMYLQKRSIKGRKIIDKVKIILNKFRK